MKTTQARRAPDLKTPLIDASGLTQPTNARDATLSARLLHSISAGDGTFNRKRGREAATHPGARILEILKATKTKTYEEVGNEFDVSKQRVGQIAQRWREYLPVRPLIVKDLPAKAGAVLVQGKRENRIHVISFRVTESEIQLLRRRYPELKSINQAARGIVTKVLTI